MAKIIIQLGAHMGKNDIDELQAKLLDEYNKGLLILPLYTKLISIINDDESNIEVMQWNAYTAKKNLTMRNGKQIIVHRHAKHFTHHQLRHW